MTSRSIRARLLIEQFDRELDREEAIEHVDRSKASSLPLVARRPTHSLRSFVVASSPGLHSETVDDRDEIEISL